LIRDQRDRRDLDHRLNDEMVSTQSASGTADDVAGRINTLLEAGLKQAVLFSLAADGDASGALLQTIEALPYHNPSFLLSLRVSR
jgi:alkanesulfonate monooxygenase SsuD/methylene tetrahydromethanopterin reductase-like flavin-dependent oxidoreductase (luciferase family)